MCLSPIKAVSNKKYFLPGRWESFYNEYPCGDCAECRQDRQLQEYVRAQWMSKECLEVHHGYVVFDTLTYNDYNLPHLQDVIRDLEMDVVNGFVKPYLNMSCFRPSDWRYFLVRLRRYLSYHYGVTENCFNYLMASRHSYGSDKEYVDDNNHVRKATERPHYHVVFYVNVPESVIDPVEFSNAVYLCWNKGNTDGVQSKGLRYFLDNRLFTMKDKDSLSISVLNVISYVSKYIGKQENFEGKFGSIMDDLIHDLLPYYDVEFADLWKLKKLNYHKYLEIKKFIKSVRPFSKKGHGYGEYYVTWLQSGDSEAVKQFDEICHTGSVVLPMNKKQNKYTCKLPQYYVRKLFYENYVDGSGKMNWRLNDLGKQYKKDQILSGIDHTVGKFEEFFQNRGLIPMEDIDSQSLEHIFQRRTKRKRFFKFVASWYRLYEGRVYDKAERSQFVTIDHMNLPSIDQMVDIQVENILINQDVDFQKSVLSTPIGEVFLYDGEPVIFNYRSPHAMRVYGDQMLSNKSFGSDDQGYLRLVNEYGRMLSDSFLGYSSNDGSWYMDANEFGILHALRLSDLANSAVIEEGRRRYLRDAVGFYAIYMKYKGKMREVKQETYDFLHDVEERLSKCYKISKKHKK